MDDRARFQGHTCLLPKLLLHPDSHTFISTQGTHSQLRPATWRSCHWLDPPCPYVTRFPFADIADSPFLGCWPVSRGLSPRPDTPPAAVQYTHLDPMSATPLWQADSSLLPAQSFRTRHHEPLNANVLVWLLHGCQWLLHPPWNVPKPPIWEKCGGGPCC